MSHSTPEAPAKEEPIESIVESPEEMRGDPRLMEKRQPASPLAFVMGSYPIILIILLVLLASYFVMSRRGTSMTDPSGPPATEVPVQSALPDPNP